MLPFCSCRIVFSMHAILGGWTGRPVEGASLARLPPSSVDHFRPGLDAWLVAGIDIGCQGACKCNPAGFSTH